MKPDHYDCMTLMCRDCKHYCIFFSVRKCELHDFTCDETGICNDWEEDE